MDEDRNARTTAIGLARYAKDYLEAAIVVDQELAKRKEFSQVSPIPAYFLLTHGLELTLKAYLRHVGLTIEQLGAHELGHNLKALYVRACELGLGDFYQMTAEDSAAFDLLVAVNQFHQLRYIQTGFKTFPSWAIAEPFVVRLHQAVAPKVGFESLNISYSATAPIQSEASIQPHER